MHFPFRRGAIPCTQVQPAAAECRSAAQGRPVGDRREDCPWDSAVRSLAQAQAYDLARSGLDSVGRAAGRVNQNVLPVPTVLSTPTLPPSFSMMRLTIDRPRP